MLLWQAFCENRERLKSDRLAREEQKVTLQGLPDKNCRLALASPAVAIRPWIGLLKGHIQPIVDVLQRKLNRNPSKISCHCRAAIASSESKGLNGSGRGLLFSGGGKT
jgi:hypothetical protein